MPQPQPDTVAMLSGKARVYDGDSIFFGRVEVRLNAIDAPEKAQACKDAQGNFWPCGIVARDALRDLVGHNEVRCLITDRDKYKRLLGTCYARGMDLNAQMVKTGNAIAYHYFSETYAAEETQAKRLHAGIWQDKNFTEPYYCRYLQAGHTCFVYDFKADTGRVAELPLIGKAHIAHD